MAADRDSDLHADRSADQLGKTVGAGVPSDAHGTPTRDPTLNVRELVIAETKRQDDLRRAETGRVEAEIHRVEAEISGLRELMLAKFATVEGLRFEKYKSIDTQFAERDKRTEQLSLADKVAIAAALQAQKENATSTYEALIASNAKTEAGFTKQIDGIVAFNTAANKSIDDKIAALNSRMDRGDGNASGRTDQSTTQRSEIGIWVGIIGLAAAIIIPLITIVLMKGS